MRHSPAHVLAAALWGTVVFKPPGVLWPLYVGTLPDNPPNATSCYTRPGNRDGRLMNGGEVITHPEVSFIIRSTGKDEGWVKADGIGAVCDGILRQTITIDGVSYLLQNASRQGDPMELGYEEGTTRWLWSLDVNVTVNQIP